MKPTHISFLRLAPWRANRKPGLRLVLEILSIHQDHLQQPPSPVAAASMGYVGRARHATSGAGRRTGGSLQEGSMLTRPPPRRLLATTFGNVGVACSKGGSVTNTCSTRSTQALAVRPWRTQGCPLYPAALLDLPSLLL